MFYGPPAVLGVGDTVVNKSPSGLALREFVMETKHQSNNHTIDTCLQTAERFNRTEKGIISNLL